MISTGLQKLDNFLEHEYQTQEIFPPKDKIFNALNLIKIQDVKVVILGQDCRYLCVSRWLGCY